MISVIKVDGMMCNKCKATVTNAVGEVNGVTEVIVNLEEKIVTVNHDATVEVETLKETIEEQGYDIID